MKCYYYFIISITLCLTSCKDHSTSSASQDNLNSPVTVNVTNSFTYSINASKYSDISHHNLSFISDSVVVTLSSSGYSSGQAIILVSDSSDSTIFCDTVKSNKTMIVGHLTTAKPRHCHFNFTNLTARLAFVVAGQ
jgi:hypothetical protein